MKRTRLIVPWENGLHLRRAASIVRLAQCFRSSIYLRIGERVANARSVLSLLTLCATMGSGLEIEITGEDEDDALSAMEQSFQVEHSNAPKSEPWRANF